LRLLHSCIAFGLAPVPAEPPFLLSQESMGAQAGVLTTRIVREEIKNQNAKCKTKEVIKKISKVKMQKSKLRSQPSADDFLNFDI
jgi:hypothetical protein